MLHICPECKRLSVEYDYYHHVEKCLNRECGWVNRECMTLGKMVGFSPPSMKLSAKLEKENHVKHVGS